MCSVVDFLQLNVLSFGNKSVLSIYKKLYLSTLEINIVIVIRATFIFETDLNFALCYHWS